MGRQESGIEDGKSNCCSEIYVVGGIGEEKKSVRAYDCKFKVTNRR